MTKFYLLLKKLFKLRFILVFILLLLLIQSISYENINAMSNNYTNLFLDNISEEYINQMDNVLIDYINNIPNCGSLLDSGIILNYIEKNKNINNYNLDDKISCDIYTIKSNDEVNISYYTIIDFYLYDEIKISNNDQLNIEVNDFLLPISPANGILLTKAKTDETWVFNRDIEPIVSGKFISVYGDQIANKNNYSRLIFSFPSYYNISSLESMPYYLLNYQNEGITNFDMHLFIFIIAIIFFIVLSFIYRKYSRKN